MKKFHLLILVFRLLLWVLVLISDLVCGRTNETVGYACSCSADYLVELLQLSVGGSLCLSSHRPFTRSALTACSIGASHSSISFLPPRLRISG
jgi:hypothetical protein